MMDSPVSRLPVYDPMKFAASARLTRRSILRFGVAAFSVAEGISLHLPAWAAGPEDEFLILSRFLTGHNELDPELAGRAQAALAALDKTFPDKMNKLSTFLAEAKPATVDDLKGLLPNIEDERFQTALAIISAWYLGRVGEVQNNEATERPYFITYREALMWKPTLDATVIPSYSTGSPGYWEKPPATIATD